MIRLYTDEQRNSFRGDRTIPKSTGKIRLFSDEQRTAFKNVSKYNSLIEQAWKIEEQTQQSITSQISLKETFRPKNLFGLGEPGFGTVGRSFKTIGRGIDKASQKTVDFIKTGIKHPDEAIKGAFESAVLKPIDFLQRTVQPNRLPEPLLTAKQREMSFDELRKRGTSKYVSPLTEPKTEEERQARQVGEFLGWLAPYSVIAKGTGLVIKGVTKAPKIAKWIPAISDAVGFLGTGQVLHEEGSRLKQLRNDALALGVFKAGALTYRGLKPSSTIKGEIDKLFKDVKGLFEKPKKITVDTQLEKEIKIPISTEKKLLTNEKRELLELREQKLLTGGVKKTTETGEGFIMTDKINKDNLNLSKAITDYNKKLTSYNANPTPTKLKTVTKAKEVMESAKISLAETKIIKINNLIKKETGLTPKQILQKELTQQPKTRLYSDAERASFKKSKQATKSKDGDTYVMKDGALVKVKKPKETPKKKTSGVALSVEAKAIEKGLTKKFKDLAEFTPTTIKKQAKKMAKEMKDVENVKGMVRGDVRLPEGLSPSTVIATMEEYALKTKDGELMAEIAKSPLAERVSKAAQDLSLMSQREKESAVTQIKKVIKTREKGVEQKLKFKTPEKIKQTIKKSLDKEISKTKPTKNSWEQLMDDIIC